MELYFIIIGLILGIFFSVSMGGMFLSLLVLLLFLLIWRYSKEEDIRFLTYIFICGISLRIIVYFIYANISIFSGKGGWLIGDGWGYYSYAWIYSQKLEGVKYFLSEDINGKIFYDQGLYDWFGGSYEKALNWITYGEYGFNGFTILIGFLFYIFNPMKFSGRLINIVFGTILGIIIYYIVKRIFGQKSAKISAILVTFFPSMFIWSLDFMKEPTYILMSIIILWSFIMYWNTKNILYIALIFIAAIIQNTLRKDLWVIGLISLSLGFFLMLRMSLKKKVIFFTAVIAIASVFFVNRGISYTYNIRTKIASILQTHIGYVNTGGYCYKILNDKYYAPTYYNINNITWYEILKAFLKGWWHFLFEPFLGDIKSKSMLMAFPQMIIWYVLLMFTLIGIASGLRYNWKYTFIITSYIFLLSSVIALTSGNIGTLFRHRDMVTPFYLIFSAAGITHLLVLTKNDVKRL